jgi:hypothetical protein
VEAIARFLETKEGFCVHFAFTMAAMARTLHIPARVAVGFTPGTQNSDGSMSVGLKDAHAWPELYFEGIGWTRFEPTPYRGSAPPYTLAPTGPNGGGPRDEAPHGQTSTPSASASPSSSCAPENRVPAGCGQVAPAADGGSGGGGIGAGRVALLALALLLALLVPAGPLLWRSRVRAVRLGGGRGRPEPLPLSAWREVLDTGWDYGVPPDDSETPRRAMARLIADGGLTGAAAASATTMATAVEQTLYARNPRPVQGLAAEVRRIRAGLHAAASRGTRLRARLLPRSAVRLLWAVSARRAAAGARLSAAGRRATDGVRRLVRRPRQA